MKCSAKPSLPSAAASCAARCCMPLKPERKLEEMTSATRPACSPTPSPSSACDSYRGAARRHAMARSDTSTGGIPAPPSTPAPPSAPSRVPTASASQSLAVELQHCAFTPSSLSP